MRKIYAGARLRRLRDERGLTQAALAKTLDLSPSYLNQLERDQRPMTIAVLLKLNSTFDLDVQFFAADKDARLVSDLHEALVDSAIGSSVPMSEIEELAARMPGVARTLVTMHRRLYAATDQLDQFSAHLAGTQSPEAAIPMPFEDVRDFFYDRRNHIPDLDLAAEQLFDEHKLTIGSLDRQLARLMSELLDVTVLIRGDGADRSVPKRHYDRESRTLTLARRLQPGQRAFQIATTLAFLLHDKKIDSIVDVAGDTLIGESRTLARIGLANYFAGALILPYSRFLRSAEELHYDIDLLSLRFEVGFETVCHRLSTLQRHGQRGVPFFFVRTDRAGNISKRQSATAFHFSRVGGSCPLWVVHEAYSSPGKILTQVAQMPDGRRYLWIARTTTGNSDGYGNAEKTFAIGLGCDIEYADRLVYSKGLQLDDADVAVPIGAGCKMCDRPSCAQRAFPQIGRAILTTEHTSVELPYPHA
ncbi:short-chain fatty acyl-CoA regulator family protein [Antrihabitans cavernicola]|uniref:ImmA/IrrE family metallo-endopeptidase n=1 Tax=Antrihabitans cavernicola TaxID=2495913 RepID=A0A5A7SJ26_9NOCA|nr:short-chain fatty acyl-CoA regulator family protein [Spelaeibacter cavernicola]KAA0024251.1 ImmA/IrrE family metallo-endopeptidase [Spelaeibacter cavernicola]